MTESSKENQARPVVQLKPVQAYQVTINGKDAGIFHQESTWEGMRKMTNGGKESLILGSGGQFSDAIADAMGVQTSATVVAASPGLHAMFEVKENQ